MNVKDIVKSHFKLHGFMLEPKAVTYITEIFSSVEPEKYNKIMDKMVSTFMNLNLSNNRITVDTVKQAINVCRKDTTTLKTFQVIDAFNIPKLKFNSDTKKYVINNIWSEKPHFSKLFSDNADNKSTIFLYRYEMIYQRLMRNNSFIFKDSLKPVTYLLSSSHRVKNVFLLGMLCQYKEGKWFLEDDTGYVEINLDNAKYHKGLILEGCFVLAEGTYEDKLMHVKTIGMPPIESASISRGAIRSNINYFGGFPIHESVKTCSQMNKLAQIELNGKALVFLSEIFLDQEIIIQKLKILFHGYSSYKPEAFIFCGDFLSPRTNDLGLSEKLKLLKEGIKSVIKSFAMFPKLALNSHLIFVPGPKDLFQGSKHVLPHPSFPVSYLLSEIFHSLPGYTEADLNKLKDKIIFTTSPCRITFYNKEIVIFRESFFQKLYRHCMYIPNEDEQLEELPILKDSLDVSVGNITMETSEIDLDSHEIKVGNSLEQQLAWTILSQGHLMPLPLHISPVYWTFDHALHLFPIPDLLILSDPSSATFKFELNGCIIHNPSNFSGEENFPFNIYYPFKGEIQNCSVNV